MASARKGHAVTTDRTPRQKVVAALALAVILTGGAVAPANAAPPAPATSVSVSTDSPAPFAKKCSRVWVPNYNFFSIFFGLNSGYYKKVCS